MPSSLLRLQVCLLHVELCLEKGQADVPIGFLSHYFCPCAAVLLTFPHQVYLISPLGRTKFHFSHRS